MIHVADVPSALDWYEQAFPAARRRCIEGFDFEVLMLDGVAIEIVPADAKVGAGASGSVVYWYTENFAATLKHLERAGAKLYRGPMDIESGWRMCQVQDPWGNCLGLRGPCL